MQCRICNNEIPEARLKAMPTATACVPCLEASGDVPRISQTSENSRNYFNVPDEVYENIPGDDSFTQPEKNVIIAGYSLKEAFEEED